MTLLFGLLCVAGVALAAAGLRLALTRPRPLDLAGMLVAPAGVWLLLAGLWGVLR